MLDCLVRLLDCLVFSCRDTSRLSSDKNMRTFRNNAVEGLTVALYILRCCQGSPLGARDTSSTRSAINIPSLDVSIENIFDTRTKLHSKEKLFSISGPQPGNPVWQENGYRYGRPNEPRRHADDSRAFITSINVRTPPEQPKRRAKNMNFDVNPSNHHNIDKMEARYIRASKPQLKGNEQISGSPSNLDIIVFKNDEDNQIIYTEDIEPSTKSPAISDYTGSTDYDSTTDDDDIGLRIGAVSDQLVASLIG